MGNDIERFREVQKDDDCLKPRSSALVRTSSVSRRFVVNDFPWEKKIILAYFTEPLDAEQKRA